MNRTKLLLTACCAAMFTAPHARTQPPPEKPRVDPGKRAVELPAKAVAAKTAPAAPAAPGRPNNPTVEPGKVRWHKSFEEAKAASAMSGKPVLLFHMMGQLDLQFC